MGNPPPAVLKYREKRPGKQCERQHLTLTNVEFVEERAQRAPEPTAMFATLTYRDLMALGVPAEMVPAARTVRPEGDLEALKQELPVEA